MPFLHICKMWHEQRRLCPFEGSADHEERKRKRPDEEADAARRAGELDKAAESRFPVDFRDLLDLIRTIGFPARRDKDIPKRPIEVPYQFPEQQVLPGFEPIQLPFPLPDAAIRFMQEAQEKGGLTFLPHLESLLSVPSRRNAIGVVIALMLTEGLRRSGISPFKTPLRKAVQLERRLAGQLKLPRPITRITHTPSPRGRGGFSLNAVERLAGDLGMDPRRLGGAF